jgi:DNA polymerase-3 subunit delta'
MAWLGILGHDDVVERFRRAMTRGRLASSFLFSGPEGIGKRMFARALAQTLLCQARPEKAMDPCGHCPSCVQFVAGTHADFEEVAKPADKSFLPLELLIGDKEHRMREGLCRNLSLRPMMGGRKVALIDDADFLNAEGANCLLKTLEEPPPRSVLILLATSPARQLPTIRSRCQLIRFRPLPAEVLAELLLARGVVADAAQARQLAEMSQGSLRRAEELIDPGLRDFRGTLLGRLTDPRFDSVDLARLTSAFVDEAGREAPARRQRLRQVVALAIHFYRQMLWISSGGTSGGPATLDSEFRPAAERWRADLTAISDCLERCLETAEQIDRNANQSTLIEGWLDSLAAAGAGLARQPS